MVGRVSAGWVLAVVVAMGVGGVRGETGPASATGAATVPASGPGVSVGKVVDLGGSHDFASPGNIAGDATEQLAGLCSLAEFRAAGEADRYVYSFEAWGEEKESLGTSAHEFRFGLGDGGEQRIRLVTGGAFPLTRVLGRSKAGDSAASGAHVLTGLGNIGWSSKQSHVFTFARPVSAFGWVYRSAEDFTLNNIAYAGAKENGYPVSYVLTDGTVVNVGEKAAASGRIKGGTNTFVGVMDKSGRGIVSVAFHVKGTGKGDQSITADDMAFVMVPRPAVAEVVNLRSSHDFAGAEGIANGPGRALEGMGTLEDFRFTAGTHRWVYDFGTWPKASAELGSNSFTFQFDVRGKGEVGQKITVTAACGHKSGQLTRTVVATEDGGKIAVLDGLGDVGKSAAGWAEQTFTFEKPVWAFGVVYRSGAELHLAKGAEVPVSYTLSDGTVETVDAASKLGADASMPAGVIAANTRTYVGVEDASGKGIKSVTFRVQGTAEKQAVYIESMGFALAGLPPGEWKLTWSDEFEGKELDGTKWSTGYRFVDVINNELQAYVPEAVTVGNGVCTIRTEKKQGQNTDQYGNKKKMQEFTSGAITTYDKFAQKYGYFEARVKMSSGPGTWPAFWLLPDRGRGVEKLDDRVGTGDRGFGFGSEIDIFEFQPWWKQADGKFLSHVGTIWNYGKVTPQNPAPHSYGDYALDNNGHGPKKFLYRNADTQFHTYGLYWSADRMVFYIDSKPVYHVRDAKHIAAVPEYILLNNALTLNGWGQGPGKKDPTLKQVEEGMPSKMEIDWVRVYEGKLEE